MKKFLIIILCTLVVIAIIFGIWFFDNNKVIEKSVDYRQGTTSAFSSTISGNEISITIYGIGGGDIVKSITNYKFNNETINEEKYEVHFETKLGAKSQLEEYKKRLDNVVIIDNVIYGDVKKTENSLKTKTDILDMLELYNKIHTKVDLKD